MTENGDPHSTRPRAGPRLPAPSDPAPPRGVMFAGEYRLGAEIATGGCGTVYAALHRVLLRPAAVKVLHRELATSAEMTERFLREAQVVNLIRHRNIVDVLDVGTLSDGRPYSVMELLHGTSLRAVVDRRGRLSPQDALALLDPVCSALEAAHEAGVVHRDLKASNVIVLHGKGSGVKLIDFGIAKLLQPEAGQAGLTAVGQRLGTPIAMSPEQVRCEPVDGRADVYALGAMLFFMLTGRYPFESADPAEIERLQLEALPPPPSRFAPVSPALDAVALRALEKSASRRFQSARAFLDALREAVGEAPPQQRRSADAAAVFVELQPFPLGGGVSTLLDDVEATLGAAGLRLFLQTGTVVVGTVVLADRAEERVEEMRKIVAMARRLAGSIAPYASVQVHADRADVSDLSGTPEVVGGPLLDLDAWLSTGTKAFTATARALEAI
jgi:serine/threonine protein kinase